MTHSQRVPRLRHFPHGRLSPLTPTRCEEPLSNHSAENGRAIELRGEPWLSGEVDERPTRFDEVARSGGVVREGGDWWVERGEVDLKEDEELYHNVALSLGLVG